MLRSLFVFAALAVGGVLAFKSALYAAAFYLWIAYFRPESWAWSGSFLTMNLSYIAGVFLIIRTAMSGLLVRVTWRSALLLVFLALTLLSTYSGLHVEHSWTYWQQFAKTIVVSYLLTVIIRTEPDLRLILFVIALSLGYEAGKQGWAQLMLNPGDRNMNSIPFLGDNNLVAVGMAMLISLISGLVATSTGWQKRALQLLNVGIVYRAISTYSRGGFLALGAVAGLFFWRSERKGRALVAAAIVAALVLPTLPPNFWERMSTITAATDEEARDDSQSSRLYFWQVALAMARDHPYLGIGHSGYEQSYDQYDTTDGRYGTGRAVHSAWFGVLAELGYIGLALFVIITLSSLRACGRVRRMSQRGETSAAVGHYATGLQSALVAFMVGGSFVSFHYSEMLWHFFALTIALEQVAETEAARIREALEHERAPATAATPAEEFAWA
jgi:probable O-glycosylation ligase (exosortase A-associated)